MNKLRLFLSSPGDCVNERNAVHRVVKKLNTDFAPSQAQIEVVAWDMGHGVPLEALASPQMSLNKHMPTPENCEIFVGIFKWRFGSPLQDKLLRKENGEIFLSGTEYEFDRAWKARRRGAQFPEVFIYQDSTKPPDSLSADEKEQFARVEAFFAAPPFKEKRTWIGSVNRYQGEVEFEQKIDAHLRYVLTQYIAFQGIPVKSLIEDKMKSLIADAGPRYTGEVHIDSEINTVFEWLLVSDKAISQFDDCLKRCWKKISEIPLEDESKIRGILHGLGENLSKSKFIGSGISYQDCIDELVSIQNICRAGADTYENMGEGDTRSAINELESMIGELEEALDLLYQFGSYAEKRVLLLVGSAGQGKTHTLVHQVSKAVQKGNIAIGLLCQSLSASTDLENAIAQKFFPAHSFDELLDALENAAAEKHSRALIAIDALNETPNRKRWRHELSGMLQKILKRPHLTVALSVRSDYRDDVIPPIPKETTPWAETFHPGFRNIEPEALQAYCSHYKAKVPLAPFVGEVSNPLYLQLLVKTLASKKETLHYFPSWLEVWQSFIERLEDELLNKLEIEPSRKFIIKRSVRLIANAMLNSGKLSIERNEAERLTERISGTKGVVNFLCSSGILMSHLEEDEEYILFGFERLTETFVTDCLLEHIFSDCSTKAEKKKAFLNAFSKDGLLNFFNTRDESNASYALRYGILRALCSAAPAHIGSELPELLPFKKSIEKWQKWRRNTLPSAFIDSLRWRTRPEEFGCSGKRLAKVYNESNKQGRYLSRVDRQILYALLPDHPIGSAFKLHNRLLKAKTPGERDEFWTILITDLWFQESCTLRSLSRWAVKTDITGISLKSALPAARLLAWSCAVSQERMRLECMQALTKIVANCPECAPLLLQDFLSCNDAYVVEAVLIATLGKVQYSTDEHAIASAKLIYNKIFKTQTPSWCHITIRHYARKIIECVLKKASISGIKTKNITPPYKSCLPLENVPSKEELRKLDTSSGYGRIMYSALDHDFFWYVMGGTSGGKPFLSKPLPTSKEPERNYDRKDINSLALHYPGIFDIPLAARFVVQNCLLLGWTSERFESFDRDAEHFSTYENCGRIERIGKKYQWIGWHTMLAFLSDNYTMNPIIYRDQKAVYDSPEQIGYIQLYDPLKWLSQASHALPSTDSFFEHIPNVPDWPLPQKNKILEWAKNSSADLNPFDIILSPPALSPLWGNGPWLSLYLEHVWIKNTPPGNWRTNQEFHAEIWIQIAPRLIRADDLPVLIEKMQIKKNQESVLKCGRVYLSGNEDGTIAEWQELQGNVNQGMCREHGSDTWLPVPSMSLIGQSGAWEQETTSTSILQPVPLLFREWDLKLDIPRCSINHSENVLFGLAGLLKKDAFFAHTGRLTDLLNKSNYTLVWTVRGERKAFLDISSVSKTDENFIWNDYHYILYLGEDGRPNGIFQSCKYLHEEAR